MFRLAVLHSVIYKPNYFNQFSRPVVRSFKKCALLYESSYTKEERSVILDKINGSTDLRSLIGPKHSKSIIDYLEKHKKISALEEMLSMPGIGPRTLNTICLKLLDKDTKPKIIKVKEDISLNITKVKELACVIIDSNTVSWSRIDCNTKYLLGWNVYEIDSSMLELKSMFAFAKVIAPELANCDAYAFQKPIFSANKKASGPLQLAYFLSAFIYAKEENPNVSFVPNGLAEKYFDATVGTERVSLQPIICDIMDKKFSTKYSNVYIGRDLETFYKKNNIYNKEQLARSCLLGIAIIDNFCNKN